MRPSSGMSCPKPIVVLRIANLSLFHPGLTRQDMLSALTIGRRERDAFRRLSDTGLSRRCHSATWEHASHSGFSAKARNVLAEFVRAVEANRGRPNLWLLGAGASASSGVATAGECIWDWKRSIFPSAHPGMEELFSELSLPSTKERIQRWFDSQGRSHSDG